MRRVGFVVLALVVLLTALPAAAQPDAACRTGVAGSFRPPVRLEVGGGASYRWSSYALGEASVATDVPLLRWLSILVDVRLLTAGERDIWLHDFESTRGLFQAGVGLRLRAEHPRVAVAPVAELSVYVIPKVEAGVSTAGGIEVYPTRDHALGLRLSGGLSVAPDRPPAPEASLRLLVRLGGGRAGSDLLQPPGLRNGRAVAAVH
jgi:hypothetical protein